MQVAQEFKPTIVAFCCNWCTYTGADLAGLNRMKYPANVRVLRVPCSSRVSPQFVLRAFQKGCDGVMVCGCHPGDCHYTSGNYYTRRRFMVLKEMLENNPTADDIQFAVTCCNIYPVDEVVTALKVAAPASRGSVTVPDYAEVYQADKNYDYFYYLGRS